MDLDMSKIDTVAAGVVDAANRLTEKYGGLETKPTDALVFHSKRPAIASLLLAAGLGAAAAMLLGRKAKEANANSKEMRTNATDDATNNNGLNEGEGNRTAARAYNQDQQRFVESGKVEEAARVAKEALEGGEGNQLQRAEEAGKHRSRGEDPEITDR